jgi:hypothetical protein
MSSGSNPIGKRACIGVRRANGGHAPSYAWDSPGYAVYPVETSEYEVPWPNGESTPRSNVTPTNKEMLPPLVRKVVNA